MENRGPARFRRTERARRHRIRAEKIETALVVALAGLIVILGAPAVGVIALGVGEMMMALMRL